MATFSQTRALRRVRPLLTLLQSKVARRRQHEFSLAPRFFDPLLQSIKSFFWQARQGNEDWSFLYRNLIFKIYYQHFNTLIIFKKYLCNNLKVLKEKINFKLFIFCEFLFFSQTTNFSSSFVGQKHCLLLFQKSSSYVVRTNRTRWKPFRTYT